MSSKAKFKSSRYDSMKLFYYRTRLRVSNAYDSIKSSLLPSSPTTSNSETDLSSDSEHYSKMKLRNKFRISEPDKIKSKCHFLEETSHRNCIAKRNVRSLRKRRSSRTRTRYCTDSDLSCEREFRNSNAGTGDQPDSSSGKETELSEKRMTQEPTSNSQISTLIKNVSEEDCSKDAKTPQTRDELEPESNQTPVAIPVLKAKRKSSTARTLKATKTKTASLPIKDETELMLREAVGLDNPVKYRNIFSKSKQVSIRENKMLSSIISRFPSRKMLLESKQKNMTVGVKVVNDNSVRKHTCMQKINSILGLSNKASNILKDGKECKNSAKDEKEIPKSDFAPNIPLFMDPYLIANRIHTTNHSEAVSQSPFNKYFPDNPSIIDSKNISNQDNYKYFPENPSIIDSKNISNQENVNQQFPRAISSYTPNTVFTRQFASLFQNI